MVVSKDSKRKRKESPAPRKEPPQQPQPSAVESSPEMPKRTKVQAQRKFAQGQSAPASSYNSITAASSSSNTGPSTSSESREPPTEILPNKRPKTEDFLTFLCFRGTPALPAHLDFLNQGKGKEAEPPVKKNVAKPTKAARKGKKGRQKAPPKPEETKAATSAAADTAQSTKPDTETLGKDSTATKENNTDGGGEANSEDPVAVPAFAVRKQAQVITEGNRRGRAADRQLRNPAAAVAGKRNISPDNKRRSNRASTKDAKPMNEPETDEDEEEYFSANDEVKIESSDKKTLAASKGGEPSAKKSKTPTPVERKSETPSKESETGKSRKGGRPSSAAKKSKKDDASKENTLDVKRPKESPKGATKAEVPTAPMITEKAVAKEKAPVKRPRQKESPIFIPSPEPSGRMTRQRAFFEPVKVPHREDEEAEVEKPKEIESKKETIEESDNESKSKIVAGKETSKDLKTAPATKGALRNARNTSVDPKEKNDKAKSSLNVFDFSSDDEQPLAKTIKVKKGKSAKKISPRAGRAGRKSSPKKPTAVAAADPVAGEEIKIVSKVEVAQSPDVNDTSAGHDEKSLHSTEEIKEEIQDEPNKSHTKRAKAALKKKAEVEPVTEDKELAPPSPKKAANARQSRKKNKQADESYQTVNGDNEKGTSPVRPNQRPSRKTKEAATIYMGIIGHKLQLPDDQDDDLSLNSFPDLPNVKEMVKMEIELKKHVAEKSAAVGKVPVALAPTAASKILPKQVTTETANAAPEKPVTAARRGRPPKQAKQTPPVKREIEGMLVKKGALAKITAAVESSASKERPEPTRPGDSEDEDFLLNEEVNETKRKLKNFSDSDDEPLAIKVKSSDKDAEQDSRKSESAAPHSTTPLAMLPLTTKPVPTPPLAPAAAAATASQTTSANPSPVTATHQQQQQPSASHAPPSPFKTIEKKSPVPTSKILNVPATYAIPGVNPTTVSNVTVALNTTFNKTTSYLPQASPHYHTSHIRPAAHSQFPTAKSPIGPPSAVIPTHLNAPPPPPPQSPLKYQTAPTTYPPPIEAYPSPKINPNFLTPKFDRTSLPRPNFPSPSTVKFDMSAASTSKVGLVSSSLLSAKSPAPTGTTVAGANNNTAAPLTVMATTSTAANSSADPLKDEIGSILAANLMPSKEESGKIFGIASVSLAQSSGPDNTKCTLGKCGSIHKPVLGPVVPTEGYIGDQLSSKERRKAKVNMTHEQIQKWLIECSSNPDEIQDDLDDDYDDNLQPNMFATTPPPTRDDKESTSFSSSSKATRDLGKSESAWSAKGPSLKATPVVATPSRKDDAGKQLDVACPLEVSADNEKTQAINLTHKAGMKHNCAAAESKISPKSDKRGERKVKEEKSATRDTTSKDNKLSKAEKEKELPGTSVKTTTPGKQVSTGAITQNQTSVETPTTSKQSRKKNASGATTTAEDRNAATSSPKATANSSPSTSNAATGKAGAKRTPVYNQKTQKQIELKETTTTSHKKTTPFSYSAFSADNEKSIYSFDKDDDDPGGTKAGAKPAFRRQSRRDSHLEEANIGSTNVPSTRSSPTKKRAAAAAAEKANKDIANASQSSSVSLTLSPSEKCKLVKVSLDAEKPMAPSAKSTTPAKGAKSAKKTEAAAVTAAAAAADEAADSDSDGHTFYIPLQGSGTGGEGEGGIQGVAVKLGREGPDGPYQKVVMHATLVTKAQMDSNAKPPPDSMNVTDIVKTLMTSTNAAAAAATAAAATAANASSTATGGKKNASSSAISSATAALAAAAAAAATANSLKSVPIGTVQPRFKGADPAASTSTASQLPPLAVAPSGSGLVRVNSNSSLFSGSAKSRVGGGPSAPVASTSAAASKKFKGDLPIRMYNNTAFPRSDDPTQMVEAPIFRPSEKEFADPIDFIERITPIAARFGICKIIPPATFKPECRISDEMRFTAYNQYVHKMLHRWGPSAKELSTIKKYLATQSISMTHPPWIGGMEVDLPRLYHTVQEQGGLKEVIEKKKWNRVAEEMCIPKLAQDRATKLDDIYCKYLLPYDTLAVEERQKLFDEVEADWAKREARARRNADRFVNTESVSNEEDDVSSEDDEESEEEIDGVSMECIVKGRSMPLSQFFRIARNTMALWFKATEPTTNEVEAEFWRHVAVRDSHVCVHSGSIDSSGWGYGFPSPGPKGKGSTYSRHPWNLKVLTNNPGSVLRSLGPVMGVTVPTLHVGMLFSACCWYRDPHGLSWIEYLHTGASKLWYGIPDDQSANFRAALTSLIPTHCQNKTIWLPCDTVMVPPHMLTDRGVSLCRIEQNPGEFIVVFPRAYTSSVATGYVVSESVYFATTSWLDSAKDDFRDIHDSCEPAMFSLEQLLFAVGYDQRVTPDTLHLMLPMLHEVIEKESAAREQLKAAGVTSAEKVHNPKSAKVKKQQPPLKSVESECDLCRANLYISMVRTDDGAVYCLQHALKNLNNGNIQAKQCKLFYAYKVEDIEGLSKNIKERIEQKRHTGQSKKSK